MVRAGACLAVLVGLAACAPRGAQVALPAAGAAADFSGLPGWTRDSISAALPVFVRGCERLALAPPDQALGGSGEIAARAGKAGQWAAVCAAARVVPPGDEAAARAFFERNFALVPIDADPRHPGGLFTGYYEPEFAGSREKNRQYSVAVLTRPGDLTEQTGPDGTRRFGRMQDGVLVPYYTRAEIEAGALRRQRLDLLYLHSRTDLFFLQIQGSGRIDLPHGHVVRLSYDSRNGQPYVPIGRVLAERGAVPPDDISAQSIRAWLDAHPREAAGVMQANPSYTFFHEQPDVSPDAGPVGALGVQLTPLRSVAVDPAHVPLGAPIYISTTRPDGSPLARLMLAQDLGSGVAGRVRADIFYGWGAAAEAEAGRMQAPGQAWLLLPVR